MQGTLHHAVLTSVEIGYGLLQVAHAAVHEFGGTAGSCGGKIPALDQDGFQAAQLSIQCAACPRSPSADHADIELLFFDLFQCIGAAFHDSLSNLPSATRKSLWCGTRQPRRCRCACSRPDPNRSEPRVAT